MKRYILFSVIIIFVFSSVFILINNTKENPKEAGTVPGDYLYFIDLSVEKIRLYTAFRWESKVSIIKRNIEERLLETEELISKDSIDQGEVDVVLDNIENNLKNVFTVIKDNSNDLDYIKNTVSDIYSSFSSFNSQVNETELGVITELRNSLEEAKNNNTVKTENIDKVKEEIENILIINDSVILINNLFNEINLNLLELLPEQDKEFLVKHYRNEEFERLREEADIYNLNLPSGLFMTLGPSDEPETVEAFRNIIKERKEKLFNEYTAHIQLIEAELYGDSEKNNLSIDQWNIYQRFLSEAQAEFNADNFQKAINLAKQAKDHIITVLE